MLFLIDLLVPDLIPFADELLLGLLTLLFGTWRTKKPASGDRMIDRQSAKDEAGRQ